jgi:hypothetical protein
MEPVLTLSGRGRDLLVYPDRVVVHASSAAVGPPTMVMEAGVLTLTRVAVRTPPIGWGRIELERAGGGSVSVRLRGRGQVAEALLARDAIVRLRSEAAGKPRSR